MKRRFVGLGELLWDLLPGGRQLGGAPANFAYHAAALGAEARVVSRVGRDDAGRELVHRLRELHIGTDCIEEDPVAPTSTVTVALGADGQPSYTIHENVAWDRLAGEVAARAAIATADVVCFGSLAQRRDVSRHTIHALLRLSPAYALRIFDVNIRQHYYSRDLIADSLALANGLKLNETELPLLAELFQLTGDERTQVDALARRFQLRVVAYTRGERGSLVRADGEWSELPGAQIAIADTVGAGDSFTATLALGLLAGWPLATVHERAAAVASYVCTQRGATPALPAPLRAPFQVN